MTDNRDQASFDAFFRKEQGRLVRQAYGLTGDLYAAQDLAQATLERAWRHWPKISSYEHPAAWTRRVLFNLALSRRKRLGRERPLEDDHDQPRPSGEVERLFLVEALRALPVSHQKALVLHDGLGLSVGEVAAELGVPLGTVKAWLSRGRSKVAEQLT